MGPPTASRDAELCAAILDPSLIAYLAGARSLGEYRRWLSSDVAMRRVAPRLAAAGRVIAVFHAENRLAMVEPWLREAGAAGDVPARVIRDKGEDEAIGTMVAEAASQWLTQRQPQAAPR
ncbi:hypothetical protein HH310_23180 [Actinoplanes sp. TBRC 11911]|uniref:hypothetical protein n=1 Tax=Actinoplanes sp. TBRC 11911 TaxID=2729386 RepID=UPI00145E5043|nr:hypothetical protein [Actinoplanes sp. TBRC 11911]NMO54074.1 hypothetical protein [Actinoplanes sp. TBRC 11911]